MIIYLIQEKDPVYNIKLKDVVHLVSILFPTKSYQSKFRASQKLSYLGNSKKIKEDLINKMYDASNHHKL